MNSQTCKSIVGRTTDVRGLPRSPAVTPRCGGSVDADEASLMLWLIVYIYRGFINPAWSQLYSAFFPPYFCTFPSHLSDGDWALTYLPVTELCLNICHLPSRELRVWPPGNLSLCLFVLTSSRSHICCCASVSQQLQLLFFALLPGSSGVGCFLSTTVCLSIILSAAHRQSCVCRFYAFTWFDKWL